jgi:hypothetical protein
MRSTRNLSKSKTPRGSWWASSLVLFFGVAGLAAQPTPTLNAAVDGPPQMPDAPPLDRRGTASFESKWADDGSSNLECFQAISKYLQSLR